MKKNTPRIQDNAIIAKMSSGNPVGEARTAGEPIPDSPMNPIERENMLQRLDATISELMEDAQNSYEANCQISGTTDIDPDYITRLSTNEFFFYTKEPLTLKEFEILQNKISEKAKNMSPGVQLILGSFAVKTDEGKVMNVTPHITCGPSPDFQFIVKNYTSPIDVRYKIPDGHGNTDTLPVLDKRHPSKQMPKITVNGTAKTLSFNNVIRCKTPGGTPFITAIDVCLDHAYGVAKDNYDVLAKKDPTILKQPISHVVVSNCIEIEQKNCLGSHIMHVDPRYSPKGCKSDISQKESAFRQSSFGKNLFKLFDVVSEVIGLIKNNYAYKTTDPSAGRDHKSYTVSLDKVSYQKSQTSDEFKCFKQKYHKQQGDYLKTQILEDMRERIENTSSLSELKDLKEELKTSYEADVLKTGQGWFTQTFGIKTSSTKALENMIEQQEEYLNSISVKYSI